MPGNKDFFAGTTKICGELRFGGSCSIQYRKGAHHPILRKNRFIYQGQSWCRAGDQILMRWLA